MTVWDRLQTCHLLSNVATPCEADVAVITSWDEATRLSCSTEWENVGIRASNALRDAVRSVSVARMKEWNLVVARIEPGVQAMVRGEAASVVGAARQPPFILRRIEWDLLGVLMEDAYSDIVPPGLFTWLLPWYLQGRLPCGLEGAWPEGRLVVF